ncbi:MAG TPA: tetratricopeptide repeat protein [Pyrinomonadaceae bacterium]|nr:tetratricopeptide repeat protein [Pyrinomonadaceae bacterium]
MSESTPDQLKLVDLGRAPLLRVLLVLPVVLALVGAWYATRWYVGNFVAEYAPQITYENVSEQELAAQQLRTAETAMRLAPDDPQTHWVVAGLKKNSLDPREMEDAVRHYEEAARLSPNDYRLWVSLGRVREQAGDSAGGEKALRRAVELAPSYADPRWHLGNLLLRAGRGEEAFRELTRAAEADPKLRPQIFNAAWVVFGEDVDAINRAAGGSAAARAELAVYVAGRGRFDDALRLWASLTPPEKKEQRASGEAIVNALLSAKRHRSALVVARDMGGADALKAQVGEMSNPGFEEDIEATGASTFEWKVRSVPQAPIGLDPAVKHGGARSLRVAFKSPSTLGFANISQTVVVEPGQAYRLEFYVRTNDLKSGGTPLVEVLDAADGKTVLAATPALANGTQDWERQTLEFRAPAASEAVLVRVRRETCGDDAVCPIFGLVWYDDFNLQRAAGGAGGSAAGAKGSGPKAATR